MKYPYPINDLIREFINTFLKIKHIRKAHTNTSNELIDGLYSGYRIKTCSTLKYHLDGHHPSSRFFEIFFLIVLIFHILTENP